MIRTSITALTVAALFATAATAQIFQESFEAAPGSTYTLTTAFDDDSFDFFDRYSVPDVDNGARDDFENGWDGLFGIISQDNDGEGGSATVSIDINGIEISGAADLSTVISLAALASEGAGFDNYENADGDGIVILASIDGGAAQQIAVFAPPAQGPNSDPGESSGDLSLDTNGDGFGDGARLTADLTDFTFNIAGTGNSLDLSIQLTSTGSFEPLAVDNVRVVESAAVPEPSALALLLAGSTAMLGRRRR